MGVSGCMSHTTDGCSTEYVMVLLSYIRTVSYVVREVRVQTYTWTMPLSSGSQPNCQCDAGALSALSAKAVNNQ
jgi:hypothetical protein